MVTSSGVKVVGIILLLAELSGPKALSHGSQSGDFLKLDGDCRSL
jgi:hypothetical protein